MNQVQQLQEHSVTLVEQAQEAKRAAEAIGRDKEQVERLAMARKAELDVEVAELRRGLHQAYQRAELAGRQLDDQRAALMRERLARDKERATLASEQQARREMQHLELQQQERLQSLLNNSVRLCFVVPTVNINLDNRKTAVHALKFPQEKIKEFVEDTVLPRFTKMVMQAEKKELNEEDKNSVSAKGFDTWLRHLLTEMQGAIEAHVARVLRDIHQGASIAPQS
ncbi:unnamed protein product [Chrysoparadoxa australica]